MMAKENPGERVSSAKRMPVIRENMLPTPIQPNPALLSFSTKKSSKPSVKPHVNTPTNIRALYPMRPASGSAATKNKRRSKVLSRSQSTNNVKPQTLKIRETDVQNLSNQLGQVEITRKGSGKSRLATSKLKRINFVSKDTKSYENLDQIIKDIKESNIQNVVVICGAGISTPSGIPDFRSPKTGLYSNLSDYNIPHPEAIFDQDYFQGRPKPFYNLAKTLYPDGTYKPNVIHYFLQLLHKKGVLLRVYTQNIDGLERLAGIPEEKLVEAHGTFRTASCSRCLEPYHPELIYKIILLDKVPRCQNKQCNGLVKPNIVFFGEDLPRKFYWYLKDLPQADLVLVLGTSLQVEPLAGIIDNAKLMVPRVLFNREAVGPFLRKKRTNDLIVKGDLVSEIKKFAKKLGWEEELTVLQETSTDEVQKGILVIPEFTLKNGVHLSEHSKSLAIAHMLLKDEQGNIIKRKNPVLDATTAKASVMNFFRSSPFSNGTRPNGAAINFWGLSNANRGPSELVKKITPDSSKLVSNSNKRSQQPAFHAQSSLVRANVYQQSYRLNPAFIRGVQTSSSDSSGCETDSESD